MEHVHIAKYGASETHWWPLSVPSHPLMAVSSPATLTCTDTHHDERLAAESISTYPVFDNGTRRDGDPVADVYVVKLYENGAFFALADGCGWGPRSFRAAKDAVSGFSDYVDEHLPSVTSIDEASRFLLRAMNVANGKIWDTRVKSWEVGTTTLLAGLLFRTPADETYHGAPYVFVNTNIGDCKAFIINRAQHGAKNETAEEDEDTPSNDSTDEAKSPKKKHADKAKNSKSTETEALDVTIESKRYIRDRCDPGGRLGPHVDEGNPDTRNLLLCVTPVYPGDTICIVSDGVHDNLDPEVLGLPLELSLQRNAALARTMLDLSVDEETGQLIVPDKYKGNKAWEAIATDQGEMLKTEYREHLIVQHYDEARQRFLKAIDDKAECSSPEAHSGGNELEAKAKIEILDASASPAATSSASPSTFNSIPSILCNSLLNHCRQTTRASREHMERNPSNTHPPDFAAYPGKMDHTTCIVYTIPGQPPKKRVHIPRHVNISPEHFETFDLAPALKINEISSTLGGGKKRSKSGKAQNTKNGGEAESPPSPSSGSPLSVDEVEVVEKNGNGDAKPPRKSSKAKKESNVHAAEPSKALSETATSSDDPAKSASPVQEHDSNGDKDKDVKESPKEAKNGHESKKAKKRSTSSSSSEPTE